MRMLVQLLTLFTTISLLHSDAVSAAGSAGRALRDLQSRADKATPSGQPMHRVFTFKNFCNAPQLQFNGDASKYQKSVFVTSGLGHTRGSVFLSQALPLRQGFRTSFRFRISYMGQSNALDSVIEGGVNASRHNRRGQGHGFAIILQSMDNRALGQPEQGLGYHGIRDAVALEFDTLQHAGLHDPDDHHISLHLSPGPGESISAVEYPGVSPPVKVPDFADDLHHTATLEYTHPHVDAAVSSKPVDRVGQLDVKIDGKKVAEYTVDLAQYMQFRKDPAQPATGQQQDGDGRYAFIGFTASTGSAYQGYILSSWSVDVVPPPGAKTVPCAKGFTGAKCTADVEQAELWRRCHAQASCMKCNSGPHCCSWCGHINAVGRPPFVGANGPACVPRNAAHKVCKIRDNDLFSSSGNVCQEVWVPSSVLVLATVTIIVGLLGAIIAADYVMRLCFFAPLDHQRTREKGGILGADDDDDEVEELVNPIGARDDELSGHAVGVGAEDQLVDAMKQAAAVGSE